MSVSGEVTLTHCGIILEEIKKIQIKKNIDGLCILAAL